MNTSFPKSSRLLKGSQFQEVSRKGKEYVGEFLRIRILPSRKAKLGLIVSRRFAHSVERNRFKRLVREAYRLSVATWPPCYLVVLPRSAALEANFAAIRNEIHRLIEHHVTQHLPSAPPVPSDGVNTPA